jgi:pimeloyl-ACP methyl ester carboxylesterase
MPGYGFSGKPTDPGWGPDRIARAWGELMQRLGYTRYVAQGGDWGSPVSSAMARQAPTGLLGIHINLPATIPLEVDQALAAGGPAPVGLSEKERATFDELSAYGKMGSRSYAVMMGTRPQTIGLAIADTPAGLAAWMLGHPGFATWTYSSSDPEKSPDEVLDDVTLYWLTNTATSAARLYWENKSNILSATSEKTAEISLPVAISVFLDDVLRPQEAWARAAFPSLIYFNEVERGAHFAAWEQPALFAQELRAAFRSLR